ncbi:MAG: trypsin-like peptidase domain-containing protein [Lachnospiraceae bacterium]|nr:trypsin-like peptidase domain-containing protein [Lachnospiraceae bacterium]
MYPYDEQGYEPPKQPKRSSGKIVIITLSIVLGVLIFISGLFLAKEMIQVIRKTGTESSSEVRENPGESVQPSSPAVSDDKSGDKVNTLTLSDSGEIGKTEVKNGVVLMDVSSIVDNVMPSIVSIVDTLEYTQSYNPYDFFFGGGSGSSTQPTSSSGTGVIIGTSDTELLIVTNNHVVSNEERTSIYSIVSKGLTITFIDGTSAKATVKGTDEKTDLAVISVSLDDIDSETKDKIRIAMVGDSDKMKVGAGVIVIGNAGGYGQSVTVGVLSAKERSVTIDGITRTLMQTDAAINPGNSGGGMFNASGELIGINSAKTVSTDIEGMGFAIPISSVKEVIENLMNQKQLSEDEQGYLGINGETIPTEYIQRYSYPAGVSISRIFEGSPAEQAGLQLYDIITKVNDYEITTMAELKKITNSYPAGSKVTLTVYRPEGRKFRSFTVEATLVSQKDLTGL